MRFSREPCSKRRARTVDAQFSGERHAAAPGPHGGALRDIDASGGDGEHVVAGGLFLVVFYRDKVQGGRNANRKSACCTEHRVRNQSSSVRGSFSRGYEITALGLQSENRDTKHEEAGLADSQHGILL